MLSFVLCSDGLRRAVLVEHIECQIDLWPADRLGKFKKRKTNMDTMKSVLLNEPFTTTKPLPPSPPSLGAVFV